VRADAGVSYQFADANPQGPSVAITQLPQDLGLYSSPLTTPTTHHQPTTHDLASCECRQ